MELTSGKACIELGCQGYLRTRVHGVLHELSNYYKHKGYLQMERKINFLLWHVLETLFSTLLCFSNSPMERNEENLHIATQDSDNIRLTTETLFRIYVLLTTFPSL